MVVVVSGCSCDLVVSGPSSPEEDVEPWGLGFLVVESPGPVGSPPLPVVVVVVVSTTTDEAVFVGLDEWSCPLVGLVVVAVTIVVSSEGMGVGKSGWHVQTSVMGQMVIVLVTVTTSKSSSTFGDNPKAGRE